MSYEIKVPELPESVADATIISWFKQPGDFVTQDEPLVELETDKVVLEVPAPVDGKLASIAEEVGATVNSDQLLGSIEEGAPAESAPAESPAPAPAEAAAPEAVPAQQPRQDTSLDSVKASPSVRKTMREHDVDPAQVTASGEKGRVLKQDVLSAGAKPQAAPAASAPAPAAAAPSAGVRSEVHGRVEERVPMTRLRKRIAERLHEATQTTAMLTTFNEVNMQPLMDMRSKYKEQFEKTHSVKLGFMSLFVKAATLALQKFPDVNAAIDGDDIVYHGYCDVGIAVASARGLVVPILRNTEAMSLADVEAGIGDYAAKARDGKLDVADLQGGTFTITNGGVFGSLFSTPILNPPQSAILGMHGITKRPVVENDEIVIRPMMYVALSYDHRIIDGQSAVLFLRAIKEAVEDPQRIVLEI